MTTKNLCTCALRIVTTNDLKEERALRAKIHEYDVKTGAINFGGDFLSNIQSIVEKIVATAKKEEIIQDFRYHGAVVGAARDALDQVKTKATGFSVGGKIAIARYQNEVVIVMYFSIGMLNCDEIVIAMGHREG